MFSDLNIMSAAIVDTNQIALCHIKVLRNANNQTNRYYPFIGLHKFEREHKKRF